MSVGCKRWYQSLDRFGVILGRILFEVVWLFSFQFRDNGIHGISIPKRTHIENGILVVEET